MDLYFKTNSNQFRNLSKNQKNVNKDIAPDRKIKRIKNNFLDKKKKLTTKKQLDLTQPITGELKIQCLNFK